MAACRGEVVYQNQGSRIEDCAAFDDQALIRSYDRAVHSFQEALGKGKSPAECRSNSESESEVKQEEEEEEEEEGNRQWWIGDSCLAVWSGDGLLYPACITAVDQDQGCCTVRFDGYGNEEAQLLTALLPPVWRPPEDEAAVREWTMGDPCQAVWSGDGLLYPATVREVNVEAGTCCVEFVRYGNQEQKELADILPPVGCRDASADDVVLRKKEQKDVELDKKIIALRKKNEALMRRYQEESSDTSRLPEGKSDKDNRHANSRIPQPQKDEKPPLPPPPHSCDNEEALLSMLLAWHLSGYHTGYYMGLRRGRQESASVAPKKRPPQHPRVSEHC